MSVLTSSCMLLPMEEEPLPPPVIGAYESTANRFAVVKRETLWRFIDSSAQKIPAHEESLSFGVGQVLINNVFVETGSTVSKGDIIAELDKSDLQRRLSDAYFQMSQLELRYKQSEEMYLLNKKFASISNPDESAYDRSMSDLGVRIQILLMDIEKIIERINERTLVSTMDGSVTYLKRVADGDRAVEKERFATITDTTVSVFIITGANAQYFMPGDIVQMKVSNSDFFDIAVADPLEIGVHNPSENAAYFAVTDIPAEYMNAQYVTVRYIVEVKEDVLCLPYQAINDVNNEKFVYVLNENVRELIPITTGMEATGGFVEILSGLEEGESVILP